MKKEAGVAVWKPQGWTPLQVVKAYKNAYPQYRNETVSYAGRLDPMAEGVLILLRGKENKRRSVSEKLRKTYEVHFALGYSTDTLDALGLVQHKMQKSVRAIAIRTALQKFLGKQLQEYPQYSSRTVHGKPLYWWARQGKISEITIPRKEIEIFSTNLLRLQKRTVQSVCRDIIVKIQNVSGDFRQQEIIKKWQGILEENGTEHITVAVIRVSCSSGTYMRQLVSDIGTALGCGAFALSIVRMKVGKYTARDALRNSAGIIG